MLVLHIKPQLEVVYPDKCIKAFFRPIYSGASVSKKHHN